MGNVLAERVGGWAGSRRRYRDRRSSGRISWGVFIAVAVASLALAGALGAGATSALAAETSCSKVEEPLRKQEEQLRLEDHSAQLPDCRSFELMSPPYKDGYYPFFQAISPDGNQALFNSLGTFGGAEGNHLVEGTIYESSRTQSGWLAKAVTPPASTFVYAQWKDASPDLRRTLWTARTASQSGDAEDLYVRETDGSFVRVGPELPPADDKTPPAPYASRYLSELKYAGASPDFTHIFFEIIEEEQGIVWPGDETVSGHSLYEYSGVGNSEPRLVGVNNKGPFSQNSEAEPITQCGEELGGGISASRYNAVSSSGDSVFFTASAATCGGFGPSVNEIYARIDKTETVDVSEPPIADCATCNTGSPGGAIFEGASQDGTKAFFLSEQEELLPGAKGMNLYEYAFTGPEHNRLIRVAQGVSEPNVQGVSRISEDGSHVYFVASGVLAANKNYNNEEAIEGGDNLYVFDSVTGDTSFIGVLSNGDGGDWTMGDSGRPVQTTPDGKFAIFASRSHLTPDDTSGEGIVQLFEYDAETGELARISAGQKGDFFCPATGKTEEGYNCNGNTESVAYEPNPAALGLQFSAAKAINADHSTISADGSTVVFQSDDPLAPQAENSLSSRLCSNVYEYRWSAGEGGMTAGNVSLVSDGQDVTVSAGRCGSNAAGMSSSGADVMVESTDRLVSQDTDTQRDVYGAREVGGFPEGVSRPECREACQGGLSLAPQLLGAGSMTQLGGNNLPPVVKAVVEKKTRPLTRAQRLARALSRCRKERRKARRVCESRARKTYGSAEKASAPRKRRK